MLQTYTFFDLLRKYIHAIILLENGDTMNWTKEEIIKDYITVTKKIEEIKNTYQNKDEKSYLNEILTMYKKYESFYQTNQHNKIKPYVTDALLKNEKSASKRQEIITENYIYIRKAIIIIGLLKYSMLLESIKIK